MSYNLSNRTHNGVATSPTTNVTNTNNNDNNKDINLANYSLYNYERAIHNLIPDLNYETTCTIATHNVCGFNNSVKQQSLLDVINLKKIDIMGITDTRLSETSSKYLYKGEPYIDSWWSAHPTSYATGGVGIIMNQKYSRYVQKIGKYKGRVIHIDLYMSGRHKLRIICTYVNPYHLDTTHSNYQRWHQERIDTHTHLKHLINNALSNNLIPIVIGDLNASADRFYKSFEEGSTINPQEQFIEFLYTHNLVDIHSATPDTDAIEGILKAPTYVKRNSRGKIISQSRIDYIWIDSRLLSEVYLADTWSPLQYYTSDHNIVIAYLNHNTLFDSSQLAHINRKYTSRKVYTYSEMNEEKWSTFAKASDEELNNIF